MTAARSGIDIAELSPEIRPQDDLFQHVHAKWLARTDIPADKARWGSFAILAEEAEQAVRTIIEESTDAEPGSEQRKVGDLFASFMDEAAIDARGIDPIRPLLAQVDGIESTDDLLRVIAGMERIGGPGLFGQYVDNDPGDPERYVVNVVQAGLGLPDESYYGDESFAETRARYLTHLETMLGHAERPDAAAEASAILALETDVAAHHWDRVTSRDSVKTYNLVPFVETYAWLAPWFAAVESPADAYREVVVHQPSYLEGVATLLLPERLDAWRSWLRAGIVRAWAPYLTTTISKDAFAFYGTALTGATEQRARWKRGVALVEGALGDIVGKVYVERHFPPHARVAMDELIANLVAAYRASIETLEWMSPATREAALEKLERFTPKIGFPVRWRTYEALEIGDDLVTNVQAAAAHEHDRELGKIGRPLDRDEWFMGPQTVNAYYNPGFNEIVFPAAILQPPFFDHTADPAANYGAIGAVIGHEIGHGFDDQGSRYDGDGRLRDWWSEEDRARFEERTSVLIAQYDALSPEAAPDHTVNGALTIGENIGDLGGLGIAWKAYLRHLDGVEAPVIDGLTGAQRFFLSWAQAWQLKIRPEEAIRLVSIDPHSPNEHRTNQIVRNMDAFYDAFAVREGDALWLSPEARVTIW
ncbi:M13 family metallopeptidase [Agrococcus jejuensis]|uniref:M13 family metallopeptidase n=1 Tax=Agrococcus jejuensis TaxID=399736 RepID=UPI0011A5244B|nr:M13-type metalloendopeptidase [Agrococcus jejuensis]